MSRGQSLVELAVCAPVALTLVLVAAAAVEVAAAQSGLDAATQAAVVVAARAPGPGAAAAEAQGRFAEMLIAYPVTGARLVLDSGAFSRSGSVTATATGAVPVGAPGLGLVPATILLHSRASAPLETWRSHE